jgi:hypothetical protein
MNFKLFLKESEMQFKLRKVKAGDGFVYKVLVDNKMIGHISGFENDIPGKNCFFIYATELNQEFRGTGIYQKAVQDVANNYKDGAYVHTWDSSPMLKKALSKMSTMITEIDKKRIWIKPKIGDNNEI